MNVKFSIWLVIYLNCTMMHGLTSLKYIYIYIYICMYVHVHTHKRQTSILAADSKPQSQQASGSSPMLLGSAATGTGRVPLYWKVITARLVTLFALSLLYGWRCKLPGSGHPLQSSYCKLSNSCGSDPRVYDIADSK